MLIQIKICLTQIGIAGVLSLDPGYCLLALVFALSSPPYHTNKPMGLRANIPNCGIACKDKIGRTFQGSPSHLYSYLERLNILDNLVDLSDVGRF